MSARGWAIRCTTGRSTSAARSARWASTACPASGRTRTPSSSRASSRSTGWASHPSCRSSSAASSSTTTTTSSRPSASSSSRQEHHMAEPQHDLAEPADNQIGAARTDETAPSKRTVLGRSKIFTPEVINDIHMKAELGRYRMRGFSMFKKIPHWDELVFLPGTLTRFVIEGYREKCETKTILGGRFTQKPIELDIPVYITGMSFGALSLEAKMALAKGASMAGTATCSGEGGMIPPERELSTKWYYQVIQSRYGFNPHHLMLADGVEFFIGQGCKVGLGGHLMGQKVTEQVAEMRSLPAGIDQRSPARHPDWLGPDDLSLKIQETREATNYEIPIQLKLGAARVYDDVRMAAKCGPDIIYLDGAEGGTGAGPHLATEETGIPLMAAIPE